MVLLKIHDIIAAEKVKRHFFHLLLKKGETNFLPTLKGILKNPLLFLYEIPKIPF